jgi:hypothetical protein
VEFSVYVLEPGESTERVLDAMRRAARTGRAGRRVPRLFRGVVVHQVVRGNRHPGVGAGGDGEAFPGHL